MTQKHENLSAFIDGESQDEHLVKALQSDSDMAAKWQRYHLIRQGLRKELPQYADFDISAQVAEALQQEPAILAPKRGWRDMPVVASVLPMARSGGQLAIAASVAVAMVLGVQKLNQEDQQIFNPAPATIPGIQGGLSPVSLEQTQTTRTDIMEQRRRINAYLTDHRQQVRLKDSQEAQKPLIKTSKDAEQSINSAHRENFPE